VAASTVFTAGRVELESTAFRDDSLLASAPLSSAASRAAMAASSTIFEIGAAVLPP
jgi:hypothetical protein